MKLPVVWIAAAFAAGILVASVAAESLAIPSAITAVSITAGAVLVWRNRTAAAWVCALAAWCALGTLASGIERGVTIVHRTAGSDFAWDGVGGEVLWPPDTGPMPEASNDDSLVIRLSDDSMRFLLSGDAQQKAEDSMVARGAPLEAAFLKVPHHGSKTSSTNIFLAAVHPPAVISVGEGNAYGHPAEAILERYAAAGVRLLRTDRDGAVTATTDGHSLTVRSFAGEQGRD